MTDREKLIAWIRDVSKFHEEVKEKWILGGKQGEKPNLIASIADHLIANGVVVREKGEWESYWDDAYLAESYRCSRCKEDAPTKAETMHDQVLKPFCPNCGADMRKGKNDVR